MVYKPVLQVAICSCIRRFASTGHIMAVCHVCREQNGATRLPVQGRNRQVKLVDNQILYKNCSVEHNLNRKSTAWNINKSFKIDGTA
jgi:hypothetical protein